MAKTRDPSARKSARRSLKFNTEEGEATEKIGARRVCKHIHVSEQSSENQSPSDTCFVHGSKTSLCLAPCLPVVYQRRRTEVCNSLVVKKSNDVAGGFDTDQEKCSEEERNGFLARVTEFIDCMNFIQGDRHFSKWKGSVVDSVVGAFLTQNVADHLSSYAFISLAARFPLPSGFMHPLLKHKRWGRENAASKTKMGKGKGKKNETSKWLSLREEAFSSDADKERSIETMDSVDWEALRNASVDEIADAIQMRGQQNRLAERIKWFLEKLVELHGSIDLEWLRNVPSHKAKEYLRAIHGLGLKSVECISLLTLHQVAFPVDTNVRRICVRLGWVPPFQPLPESALHLLKLKQYPKTGLVHEYLWTRLCTLDHQTLYALHYHMITFGKVFCTETKPNCTACPMRGKCKYYASALASANLALPLGEEKILVISEIPSTLENDRSQDFRSVHVGSQPAEENVNNNYETIIEDPVSPEHERTQAVEITVEDIEDTFYKYEEILKIDLKSEKFKNLKHNMQESNIEMRVGDMSKNLVASIPMSNVKKSRFRTERQVYELPDSHFLLQEMDCRVPDDPCPYLLAIWTPGEIAESTKPQQPCCNTQDSAKLCNSMMEACDQIVRGTILIPIRTAMKDAFPLNGTFFQPNEVFADHSSSHAPIRVPREEILGLPRCTVSFGASMRTMYKGSTMESIRHGFCGEYACVTGFDRASRTMKPLHQRVFFPHSKAVKKKKAPSEREERCTSKENLFSSFTRS